MNTQPTITDETIQRMEDMSWFTHTQIFDDLLIVAQKETACYVWKTGAGENCVQQGENSVSSKYLYYGDGGSAEVLFCVQQGKLKKKRSVKSC